jgi:hypothetical protein
MFRILCLATGLLVSFALVSCGGEEPTTASDSAPVSAAREPAGLPELSADEQACLDHVRQEQYVDAIEPCKRALEEGSDARVTAAYEEASEAVAEQAKAAAAKGAAKAAADPKAASKALGGYGSD